jgi:hypothetical protein
MAIKFVVCIAVLCIAAIAFSQSTFLINLTFDQDQNLDHWRKMILNGEVRYTLEKTGPQGYIEAFSDNACSALYYRVKFNAQNYPFLSWKWRVLRFPEAPSALAEKQEDDYAARVYVIFPFLSFSTSKFIEYVWARNLPEGTMLDSPYGSNVKMIVAQSGMHDPGVWVGETRNIYEDYVRAFGRKPTMTAGAVAIMCDADGTQTSAHSFFDDITIAGK